MLNCSCGWSGRENTAPQEFCEKTKEFSFFCPVCDRFLFFSGDREEESVTSEDEDIIVFEKFRKKNNGDEDVDH